MSTYVISDIHGCYNDFLSLLDKIGFSDADRLILAGDYIDRGKQSHEMLKWLEQCPDNVRLVRGNHDEEFAAYVDLMLLLDKRERLESNFASNEDAVTLYESVTYFLKNMGSSASYFDAYGTIGELLRHFGVTMNDLCRWAEMIRRMSYYHEVKIGDRPCVVVHAGYAESLEDIGTRFSRLEGFYLYAREEGFRLGGKLHGMVVAGHTPTIVKGEFTYNKGNVFRYYDKAKDCVFYDIDCGCVFRSREPDAKLACFRLEDERSFYV